MDSAEAEDTGVFSPDASKRCSLNQVCREHDRDISENDGTNVFSPDVLQSRPNSPGGKENTPSATETPVTKQVEDFDKKNVKRKRHFFDALNTPNLNNDSCDQSVEEDSIFNLKKQVNNEKRAKRFRLSLEVPSNDSNSDYTGIGSSASQEDNQNQRKKRFVVSSTQENDDSTYSDVFKSASQGENIKRKSRFAAPPSFVESDDSLLLSNVFKSNSKDKKRNCDFKVPKSPVESQDSVRYSDLFKPISQDKKNNRKPRFVVEPSLHESCDSSEYSDVFKSLPLNERKKNRDPRFGLIPSSQDSCDDSRYSDILKSTSKEKEVKRKNRFVIPSCSQDNEDSRQYSAVFESVSISADKAERKNRFAVPFSQDSEDSSHYSDILIEQKDNKKFRIDDPVSQGTEDSLRYSDISIAQNETEIENEPIMDSNSQEIEEICIDTIGSSLSIEKRENTNQDSCFENTNNTEHIICEKTSSTVSTSVRSIYIDMIRSSLNVSNLLSVSEEANKPFNQTYDVSTSAFPKCEDVLSLVNVNMHNLDELKNDSIHPETIGSPNNVTIISTLNASNEQTLIGFKDHSNDDSTLIESKNESSRVHESIPVTTDESKDENSRIHESNSAATDESKDESSAVHESIPVTTDESKDESSAVHESISMAIDESKDEISAVHESIPATTDECKDESSAIHESISAMTDESKNKSSASHESIPVTTDEFKGESSAVHESISATTSESKYEISIAYESVPVSDASKTENFKEQKSVSASDKFLNESTTTRKSMPVLENIPDLAEDSEDGCNEVESNITPAISVQAIKIDTIHNSLNTPLPIEKVIEESVYAAFNPSSLMLSVTEMVEPTLISADKNVSNHLDELPIPNDSQSGETPVISSSAVALNEENIKEHDYAMVHVTNAEEAVSELVVDIVGVSSAKEISEESMTNEIITPNSGEFVKEPAAAPINTLSTKQTLQGSNAQKAAQEYDGASNNVPCVEEIAKEQSETPVDVPCAEIIPKSNIVPPQNDQQISKKLSSTDASTQSANYSLRTRKSRSNVSKEQNISVDLANLRSSSPSAEQTSPDKPSASISHSSVVQPHEESMASNSIVSKSNYSLRSRNSRSSVGQKSPEPVPALAQKSPENVLTVAQKSHEPSPSISIADSVPKVPEPVPSTSASALNNDRFDDTGDALFNFSNSMNDIPSRNFSEVPSQGGSYSRSRNSFSSQTLGSKSSVSVFSISKIGRRSSAFKEFKIPQVPKIVPKKKNKADPSFKHLPSRPNFPKFDFYCNKRFYDYLTSKMESKYGIRTNNKAVELAKYISEVVQEVIAMKTGNHHILIEEMKKVLFKAGIVTTHYNFYMFCFDYLPPWFRRKAIPMMRPIGCHPNVEFDVSTVFNSIG